MAWSDDLVTFARLLQRQRARQAEELAGDGGDVAASPLVQKWLLLAQAAEGTLERTPGNRTAVRAACASMADVVFSLPYRRFEDPAVPDRWWENDPIGRLWWLARVWAEDDLISLQEAAELAGVSLAAVAQRRDLPFYIDTTAPNPMNSRRRVRRADVERIDWGAKGTGPRRRAAELDSE